MIQAMGLKMKAYMMRISDRLFIFCVNLRSELFLRNLTLTLSLVSVILLLSNRYNSLPISYLNLYLLNGTTKQAMIQ